ncbi:MAG: ankyrin repeat domain-containing protein [Desulfobacteraceae bacterium]|nr:ankyrin repeat domain-containing protein [Desulfobacteraceae bacterium]
MKLNTVKQCDAPIEKTPGNDTCSGQIMKLKPAPEQMKFKSGCRRWGSDINVSYNINKLSNSFKKDNDSMLPVAARQNNLNHTRIALKKNELKNQKHILPNSKNNNNAALFDVAVAENNDEVIAFYKELGLLDATDQNGKTLLIDALINANDESAKKLIEMDANLDAKDKNKDTALTIAIRNGKTDIAKQLIEKDVQLDAQNYDDDTALLLSIKNGRKQIAQLLLDTAKNPSAPNTSLNFDATDSNGNTALMLALKFGHKDIAMAILNEAFRENSENQDLNLNATNQKDRTALMIALRRGYENIGMAILNEVSKEDSLNGFFNFDTTDSNGNTALMIAIKKCQKDIINKILSNEVILANIDNKLFNLPRHHTNVVDKKSSPEEHYENVHFRDIPDSNKRSPLMVALSKRDFDTAKKLLNMGADIHSQDISGKTALIIAAENGCNENVKILIENMTVENMQDDLIDQIDNDGNTALLSSVGKFVYSDLAAITLVRNGAKLDMQDKKFHDTALTRAIANNHIEAAEAIIDKGIRDNSLTGFINLQNNRGETALMIAIKGGHYDLAEKLVINDAELNLLKNTNDRTALMMASYQKDAKFDKLALLMLEKGARADIHDELGRTAFIFAVANGLDSVAEKMIDNTSNKQELIEQQDNSGINALMYATIYGHCFLAKKLISDYGADVNKNDDSSNTALMYAAMYNQYDIAKSLLAAGAQKDVKNKNFNTALDIVQNRNSNEKVIPLLKLLGGKIYVPKPTANRASLGTSKAKRESYHRTYRYSKPKPRTSYKKSINQRRNEIKHSLINSPLYAIRGMDINSINKLVEKKLKKEGYK